MPNVNPYTILPNMSKTKLKKSDWSVLNVTDSSFSEPPSPVVFLIGPSGFQPFSAGSDLENIPSGVSGGAPAVLLRNVHSRVQPTSLYT